MGVVDVEGVPGAVDHLVEPASRGMLENLYSGSSAVAHHAVQPCRKRVNRFRAAAEPIWREPIRCGCVQTPHFEARYIDWLIR